MGNKLKHLEFIQETIKRMAGNSFLLKGWSITLASALFAASLKFDVRYLLIVIPVILFFWIFDSYFLWQERMFRGLYDNVRSRSEKGIDFKMNPREFNSGKATWLNSFFSITFLISYLPLIVFVAIFLLINS